MKCKYNRKFSVEVILACLFEISKPISQAAQKKMFLRITDADAETSYLNSVINESDNSTALGCSVWSSYMICVR